MKPLHELTDDELEATLRDGRTLESAPEHVIQRALAAWQPRRPAAAPVGPLRRLVAVLGFDSGVQPALAGVRAGGAPAQRQFLFSADGHDVELRVSEPAPGSFRLFAQVLGPEAQGRYELVVGDRQWSGALDDLGEFVVEALPAGQAGLQLQLGDTRIELPPVPLGPA